MLDVLLSRLKEEIAIDGRSGSNIETVWGYVESISTEIAKESGVTITPTVDDKYKAYIWNYLKLDSDLELYEVCSSEVTTTAVESIDNTKNDEETPSVDLTAPETDKEVVKRLEEVDSTSKKRKDPPSSTKSNPKKKTKAKGKSKKTAGSDDDFDSSSDIDRDEEESDQNASDEEIKLKKKEMKEPTRKEPPVPTNLTLKQITGHADLSYDDIKEKFGSKLHVVGSIRLQEQQLYLGIPPGDTLSPNLTIILQEILKTRAKGFLQADITTNLGIDSRSTGHYCKSLEEKGAITRTGVSTRNMRSNMCIHARFAINENSTIEVDNEAEIPYNMDSKGKTYSQVMLRDALVDLIKDAPNMIILSEDVLRALGFDNTRKTVRKWYNRTINELCGKGYIRKVNADIPGMKRVRRCLQLIKIPEKSEPIEMPMEQLEYPIRVKSVASEIPILSFLADSSLESQIQQVLMAAGENGATQKEIGFALNTDEGRTLYRALDKMCELEGIGLQRYGAMRVLEFEGKVKRYRYHTYQAYQSIHDNVNYVLPPLPEPEMDESTFHETDPSIDVPHTVKEFRKHLNGTSRASKPKKPLDPNAPPPKLGRPRKNPVAELKAAKKGKKGKGKATEGESSQIAPPADASTGVLAIMDTTTHASEPAASAPILQIQDNTVASGENQVIILGDDNTTPTEPRPTDLEIQTEVLTPTAPESSNPPNPTLIGTEDNSTGETSVPAKRKDKTFVPEESPAKKAKLVEANIAQPPNTASIFTSARKSTPTPPPTGKVGKPKAASAKATQNRSITDFFSKPKPVSQVTTESTLMEVTPVEQEGSTNVKAMEIDSDDHPPGENPAVETPVITDVSVTEAEATVAKPSDTQVVVAEPHSTEGITAGSPTIDTPADTPMIDPPTESQNALVVRETTDPAKTLEITSDNSRFKFRNGPSHKGKQVNIYMEIRMRVLLALLEENPMREVNKDLMTEYTKKATILFGPPKYSVCKKTMWRSATVLEQRGQAQTDTFECNLLNGATVVKKILLGKDVDKDSKEYHLFKKRVGDRRIYQQPYFITDKSSYSNLTVESLEDRIKRMEAELKELESTGRMSEALELQRRLEGFSENASKFKRQKNSEINSWLITGIQFGWIRAIMLRVKLLHQFLFSLLERGETIEGIDKENSTIALSAVVRLLPLRVYCSMIGVFEVSSEISAYVRDPNNGNITHDDMPTQVKAALFSDHNKFRRRLRTLFYRLEYLDLVTAIEDAVGEPIEEKFTSYPMSYSIARKVAIRDLHKVGKPVLREHTLTSSTDLTLYWSELQYACTKTDLPEDEEKIVPPEHPIEKEIWKGLSNIVNWSSASVYTRSQRKILNKYVDKTKGTTPLNDYNACAEIADEIETNIVYVRRYYAKIEVAIERKNKNREQRNLERRLQPVVSRMKRSRRGLSGSRDGRRAVTLSSTKAFQPTQRIGPQLPSIIASRDSIRSLKESNLEFEEDQARGKNLYFDSMSEIPLVASDDLDLRQIRNPRMAWNEDDDELLMYTYIILKQRTSRRSDFRWQASNQVFPQRNANQCRNRMLKLNANPIQKEQINTSSHLWTRFYREGIQRKELDDPSPREMVDFDILAHLTYFLKRLNAAELNPDNIKLPLHITDMKQHLNVIPNANHETFDYLESEYNNANSLVMQMKVIHSQSLSGRIFRPNEYDIDYSAIEDENYEAGRNAQILKVLVMMILLCPSETYDPFFAYSVLLSYPEVYLQRALDELKAANVICGSKTDRRVPGTKYCLTARFFTWMNGKMPKDMLKQAKSYLEYLNEQTTIDRFIPEFTSGGMMACMMELISKNKLDLSMANKAAKMKKLTNLNVNARRINRKFQVFDVEMKKTCHDNLDLIKTSTEYDAKKMTLEEFDECVKAVLDTMSSAEAELAQLLITTLLEQEATGLTLYEWKCKIKTPVDDAFMIHVVQLLESAKPAIVCSVGFSAPRYVTVPFIAPWVLITNSNSIQEIGASFAKGKTPIKAIERKEIVKPKFWVDINGFTTELVLKECKEAIIDFILRRPGIHEASIQRHFSMAFSRTDLHDLLLMLVEDKVLKKVELHQPNSKLKRSIFTKPRSIRCTPEPMIEKNMQTCYWITSVTNF